MRLASFILALALATPATGQETDATAVTDGAAADAAQAESAEEARDADVLEVISAAEVELADFLWTRRPIVVFADTPADPRFNEQLDLLARRPGALTERDVVIVTDTDPAAETSVRRQLRPRGFQLVLIGKDGEVKLRKPFPWDVREITRSIDKWPLRKDELRTR